MVPRRLRRLNARGYTIVELALVATIMGIVAVMTIPYVSTYLAAASLRAGAAQLVAILNGARQLAITRNTNVCIALSANSAQYRTGVSNTCVGGATFIGTNTT